MLKVRLLVVVGFVLPQVYRMDAEKEVKHVGGLLANRVAILLLQRLHLSQAVAPPQGHLVPKTVIVVVGTVRVKGRIPSLANKEVVIMGRCGGFEVISAMAHCNKIILSSSYSYLIIFCCLVNPKLYQTSKL